MGSPTCPTCGKDADFVETFHGARSCYHPFHATPTPPAPADDAGCIIVKSPRPCPDCDGTGWLAGDPCPLCSGLAPGEREDARLKHQRGVEKARRADDAGGAEAMREDTCEGCSTYAWCSVTGACLAESNPHDEGDRRRVVSTLTALAPLPARDDASGAKAMRLADAIDKVARAAGYERGWVAPSGEPNIILERRHPTSEGMIKVTRLDLCVSVPAPDDAVEEAGFDAWLDEPIVPRTAFTRRQAMFSRVALPDSVWELVFGFAAEAWEASRAALRRAKGGDK